MQIQTASGPSGPSGASGSSGASGATGATGVSGVSTASSLQGGLPEIGDLPLPLPQQPLEQHSPLLSLSLPLFSFQKGILSLTEFSLDLCEFLLLLPYDLKTVFLSLLQPSGQALDICLKALDVFNPRLESYILLLYLTL